MSINELNVQIREELGKKNSQVRENGFIPAVIYGKNYENKLIKIQKLDFKKLFENAGFSSLVDLKIGEKESFKVIIKSVDHNPITDEVDHVDFHKISMDEELEAVVDLIFEGSSPYVKEYGAILSSNMSSITIKCLPENLINNVKVDLSVLVKEDSQIKVKDLGIADNVKILDDANAVVAGIIDKRKQNKAEKDQAKMEAAPKDPKAEEVEPEEDKKETSASK